MNTNECLAKASNPTASRLASVGRYAECVARGIGHASLLTTAAVADFCGTAILSSGLISAGVLKLDLERWVNLNQETEKPSHIWAHFHGPKAVPLIMANERFQELDDEELKAEINTGISLQYVTTIALLIASPLASYACFKISSTARQIDRDLFQTA